MPSVREGNAPYGFSNQLTRRGVQSTRRTKCNDDVRADAHTMTVARNIDTDGLFGGALCQIRNVLHLLSRGLRPENFNQHMFPSKRYPKFPPSFSKSSPES